MVTWRNPDLDKEGKEERSRGRKRFYPSKVGSPLKAWVVTTGFGKVPLAAMGQQTTEGQGLDAGDSRAGSWSPPGGWPGECDRISRALPSGLRRERTEVST